MPSSPSFAPSLLNRQILASIAKLRRFGDPSVLTGKTKSDYEALKEAIEKAELVYKNLTQSNKENNSQLKDSQSTQKESTFELVF